MSIMGKRIGTGLALTVAMSLIALTTAGCGSGGQSGLSRSGLIGKVDAVCKQHREIVTAAASRVLAGGQLPGPAKFGRLAHETIIPQYRMEIAELSPLKPPAKQAGAYQKWLADSQATLARMGQNPVIITNAANFAGVNRGADALGFSSDCHVGPG